MKPTERELAEAIVKRLKESIGAVAHDIHDLQDIVGAAQNFETRKDDSIPEELWQMLNRIANHSVQLLLWLDTD